MMQKEDLCGIGSCKPQWLQAFRTIRVYTFFACGAIVTQGLYLGYTIGVLTTIEKRFEIPSASSGALLSVYDVGHSICVLIIGHFGVYLHKPKWIAMGNFLSAVASLGLASPNFIYGPMPRSFINSSSPEPNFCDRNASNLYHSEECGVKHPTDSAYLILVFFQLLAGIASAPSVPLIFVYIDDNCSKQQSPLLNGFVTAAWAVGPALGIGFSSLVASWHVTLETVAMDPSNPNWISAWWLGFVVCSVAYLVFGLPLLLFPKSMSRFASLEQLGDKSSQPLNRSKSMEEDGPKKLQPMTAKLFCTEFIRIPLEVWHLLKNPMFVSLTFLMVFGASIVGGYATFMPKYIEVEFYKTTNQANINAGVVFIFGVAMSTAIGGKILSYFDPLPKTLCIALLGTFTAGFLSYLVAMMFGCDNVDIQGIHSIGFLNNSRSISSCDQNCYCPNEYNPICSESVTYFSPCHAGCSSSGFNSSSNLFNNCSCSQGAVFSAERCDHSCPQFVFYMIDVFVGSFLTNLFQVAVINLLMWSVSEERKTTSVALTSLISSLLGFMPAQIIYGKIIDSACVHWSTKACETGGYCQLFDNGHLRIFLHLITMGFSVGCIIAAAVAYWFARNFVFHLNQEKKTEEISLE